TGGLCPQHHIVPQFERVGRARDRGDSAGVEGHLLGFPALYASDGPPIGDENVRNIATIAAIRRSREGCATRSGIFHAVQSLRARCAYAWVDDRAVPIVCHVKEEPIDAVALDYPVEPIHELSHKG